MVVFNNIFVGFSVVLLVLILVFYVCYNQTLHLIRDENESIAASNPMQFVFERNGIVDCAHTKLPCVTDRQCVDNCAIQNAVGTMVCDEGFCSNRDAQVSGRPDDFECDSALGLIKVFVASEFVVNQLCISTYRDIVDDSGQRRPYVCDDGVLDLDLANRQFTADDCVCDTGYTKMIFNQTALVRSVPVCVPNSSAAMYARVY
ncbi:ac115-like protein [Orgyia leucostigma nucleopolyhedrovirus]|uniref:Ac115-like protein n=1 Tax=Orgyia leucostigma nucleopolyhedrovirus TaxID=490711 RepID=B0FDX0_9ABAC|nr:ac115-like protein [Orgyia leucostigma nucleopolyhedrovirus]ABY65828.1 ac115-like protein [Orgyia leucostigma nucleopolyhedrovirus]